MKAYIGALKYAFSRAYGEEPGTWTTGAETADDNGQAVCEFKNEKSNILLRVTDQGKGKFNAKRIDAAASSDEEMNLSIPQSWTKLSF